MVNHNSPDCLEWDCFLFRSEIAIGYVSVIYDYQHAPDYRKVLFVYNN